MTGFAWFVLTRTSQSTTSHTHTHSHKKRVNRHRFSRLKRHFLFFFFFFFFSKGFEYKKPFNVHRALSLSFFSFDSFVYMCVCLLCGWRADGEFFTDALFSSISQYSAVLPFLMDDPSHIAIYSRFFFFFYPFLVLLCCFLYTRTPSILPFGTNMHNWRIGLSSLFSHCHGRC